MTGRALPIVEPAPAAGACCDACAAELPPAEAGSARVVTWPERLATVTTSADLVGLELDSPRTVALAAGRILWLGAVPAAWSLGSIAAPLAIGWIVQVLIGAWSQLLPTIGPSGMAAHARQRTSLGRAATERLVALNLGVALVMIGGAIAWTAPVVIGVALCGVTILASLGIFVVAARTGGADGPPGSLVAARGGD